MQEPVACRAQRVFGDVLPDSTSDDQPDDDRLDQEDSSSAERDRWLRDNRPPHHDRSPHHDGSA